RGRADSHGALDKRGAPDLSAALAWRPHLRPAEPGHSLPCALPAPAAERGRRTRSPWAYPQTVWCPDRTSLPLEGGSESVGGRGGPSVSATLLRGASISARKAYRRPGPG